MENISPMKDKRLSVGGLQLPHDTRGNAGSISDKVGSVSATITQGSRISDSTLYTTTETDWVDVGEPLEFYLDRFMYLIIFTRFDIRNNNGNDDASATSFRLYDTPFAARRAGGTSMGEFAYNDSTGTTYLNYSQTFDLDVLGFSAGLHSLQPQIKVDGTGTARLDRMDYGYQALGN